MDRPTLEAVPEDWDSCLAIVAHPDDLEFGASCALARWSAQGKDVVELLATRGEAGIDGMAPAEAAEVRTAEQEASAAVVGASAVEFLDHADGMLQPGLDLRRDLARARSEERRAGEESGSTCRSRGWPDTSTKKKHKQRQSKNE